MNKFYALGAALVLSPLFMNAQTDCTPHMQVSNAFENGSFIEAAFNMRVANDFIVSPNTASFNADQLSINLLSQGGIATVDIFFLEDDNGTPGAEITDLTMLDVVPTSQDSIGANFGYDVHEVIFDFATPLALEGGRYWLNIIPTPTAEGTRIAWETTSLEAVGSLQYSADGDQPILAWQLGAEDGVFSISGECVNITEGCLIPENVTISNATATSFDVMWDEVGDATEWIVEYGESDFTVGSGTMVTDDDGTPGITISDLDGLTDYTVYVKSVCSEDESGNSIVAITSTLDIFCVVSVTVGVEPITNVEFAGITNITEATATAPNEYFLDMVAMVNQNGTFPIALEGFTGGDFNNSYVVFIDWNQDSEFNNDEERYEIGLITNSTGVDGMQATGNIEVPADATLGATRMRVVKIYTGSDEYATDGCADVDYGQTEDYTVNVDVETSVEFAEYEFKMGPNPTKDFVNISATETIERVALYNLLGQQVYVSTLNVQSPQVDLSSFENGVYMMSITIKGQQQVFKVVKQ